MSDRDFTMSTVSADILDRIILEELVSGAEDVTDEINYRVKRQHADVVSALSSVLNYILTDAFTLTPEESMFTNYHLGVILAPLEPLLPTAVPLAVEQELSTGEYSDRMFAVKSGRASGTVHGVAYGTLDQWVEVMSEIVFSCYPDVRPMISARIIGGFYGILAELGVSDEESASRASLYLPTAVRYKLKPNAS